MGKIIEFIFTRVYVAMLVTGIFWVLTICGGVLLGVGPAGTTVIWSQPIKSFTPSLPLKGFSSMACTS